jgi:hypothetical protein
VSGQTELFEVIDTLRPAGRLARRLHGRQQQRDQYRNDCDDDQELDERKRTVASHSRHDRTPLSRWTGLNLKTSHRDTQRINIRLRG